MPSRGSWKVISTRRSLRFPRDDAPTLLRSRYLHRTVQATRLYPGLHEEVVSISGGDDLLAVRLRRTWDGTTGPVEVDVHIVFEHDDGPTGARLLTAWEFLGPEVRGPDQA